MAEASQPVVGRRPPGFRMEPKAASIYVRVAPYASYGAPRCLRPYPRLYALNVARGRVLPTGPRPGSDREYDNSAN